LQKLQNLLLFFLKAIRPDTLCISVILVNNEIGVI